MLVHLRPNTQYTSVPLVRGTGQAAVLVSLVNHVLQLPKVFGAVLLLVQLLHVHLRGGSIAAWGQ